MRQGASGVYYWENREQDKYGEFIMMNTPSSLSGRHWQPFLYEVYLDEELQNHITLEEYGNPIIINQTGTEIRCLQSYWEFKYTNGDVKNIAIPQQDDIDIEDRILILKAELKVLLSADSATCN